MENLQLNEIPASDVNGNLKLENKIRTLSEENVINSNAQIETLNLLLRQAAPDLINLLGEFHFSYSIENEIIISKKDSSGVRFLFIDDEGDFGYNFTPYEGTPLRLFYEKNETYGLNIILLHLCDII